MKLDFKPWNSCYTCYMIWCGGAGQFLCNVALTAGGLYGTGKLMKAGEIADEHK